MSLQFEHNKELYHYGVLGMRWGVRRGKTTQAYEKASKKLKKLDDKVEKTQTKANKLSAKADRKIRSSHSSEEATNKAIAKATKAQHDVSKTLAKADKWYKSMDKTFKNTSVSLSAEQVAAGRRYVDQLNMRSQIKYLQSGY